MEDWEAHPGGWPDDVESALIDAVFSARAVYRSKWGRGVQPLVVRWQGRRRRKRSRLDLLAREISSVGPDEWAATFGSAQWSPGRSTEAPGGATKAAAVLEAAEALAAVGVNEAGDITDDTAGLVRTTLLAVQGIGYATTNYFLILLGRPGVKPDRMVHRFLNRATARRFTNREAEELVEDVAGALGTDAHLLDHAIWRFESDQAAGR